MCLAYPGEVKNISKKEITVEYPSSTQKVLSTVLKLKVGDKVLVQMGLIIKVLTQEESQEILNAWNNL